MLANFILPPANSRTAHNGAVVPLHYRKGGGINTSTGAQAHTCQNTHVHVSKSALFSIHKLKHTRTKRTTLSMPHGAVCGEGQMGRMRIQGHNPHKINYTSNCQQTRSHKRAPLSSNHVGNSLILIHWSSFEHVRTHTKTHRCTKINTWLLYNKVTIRFKEDSEKKKKGK